MWCEKQQIDWVFEKHRLQPQAKVNHFRGWTELCRKDMLNKNLKKFKRNLEKQGNREESNEYDFLPSTFLLPSEYVIFYEEFKKLQLHEGRTLWIMKPVTRLSCRHPNARERAFSSSTKQQRFPSGKLLHGNQTSKTTSANVTFSTLSSSEGGSST